jgi:hypothetical protein
VGSTKGTNAPAHPASAPAAVCLPLKGNSAPGPEVYRQAKAFARQSVASFILALAMLGTTGVLALIIGIQNGGPVFLLQTAPLLLT